MNNIELILLISGILLGAFVMNAYWYCIGIKRNERLYSLIKAYNEEDNLIMERLNLYQLDDGGEDSVGTPFYCNGTVADIENAVEEKK